MASRRASGLEAAGGALGRSQRLELDERGFGRNRFGWLADVIGFSRRMAVIRELRVAVGIELVADRASHWRPCY